MNFSDFGSPVFSRYQQLAKSELYVVDTSEVDLFAHYLASFPEGTNPIYRERTEHDCSCCKNFIRNLGRVVAIIDNKPQSIWPTKGLPEPYLTVSRAMNELVLGLPVLTIFRTKERSYGAEFTRELLDNGKVKKWEHFHGSISTAHFSQTPDQPRGMFDTTVQVFRRGLDELSPDALAQVVDLIESNSIYRGEEHLAAVKQFQSIQAAYRRLRTDAEKRMFVLVKADDPATRFRNTVIGTLVQALSEGEELERAVSAFEAKVAPTNYKRTTALITPAMVRSAMQTIKELNLEAALERRLARLSDVSVNNVLWVDRGVRGRMKGGSVESLLMAHAESVPTIDGAQDVSIDDFMSKLLPKAEAVDLLLRNTQTHNFMTITAPVHADAGRLFRWSNGFAWSYDGNITDSIREKVKAAGGNVNADLRFSLAWYNYDDLDIHVKTPYDVHYYFGNKGRILDVDMNAGFTQSRQPVENLSFVRPEDGVYEVWVNQYNRRETSDVGFTIEIENEGRVTQLSYKKGVQPQANIPVGRFKLRNGVIVESVINEKLSGEGISQDKWGIKTEKLHPVQTVMFSPNYWDENRVGNKHVFFILEGCKVDGPARGIYNEFLNPALEKHRKVFEVLGDKTKCQPAEEQLSGVGFSSTRGDKVTVAVKVGTSKRLFNVVF